MDNTIVVHDSAKNEYHKLEDSLKAEGKVIRESLEKAQKASLKEPKNSL